MSADSPETEQKKQKERARARKLFAAAQECSAAAQYKKAMRLLEKIPAPQRSDDYDRMLQQVQERIEETQTLAREVRLAIQDEQLDDPELLVKVRRLVELKPGDEWANETRHQLETRAHGPEEPVIPELPEVEERVPVQPPSLPEDYEPPEADSTQPGSPPPIPVVWDEEDEAREEGLPLAGKIVLWIVLVLLLVAISLAFTVAVVKGSAAFVSVETVRQILATVSRL